MVGGREHCHPISGDATERMGSAEALLTALRLLCGAPLQFGRAQVWLGRWPWLTPGSAWAEETLQPCPRGRTRGELTHGEPGQAAALPDCLRGQRSHGQ